VNEMMRCAICGKEAYVDGNAECPECARLRGYDDIELKRKIRKLEAEIDNHTYPGTTSTGHRVRQHTGQQWRGYER